MISDFNYYSKVFKKTLYLLLTTAVLFFILKTACFYMPFLISFFIAMMFEPIIRFFMKKLKITRKASSIILIAIFISLVTALIAWGIGTLFNESSKLINNLDYYIKKIQDFSYGITNSKFAKNIPKELIDLFMMSKNDLLNSTSATFISLFNKIKDLIFKIPDLCIIIFFSICALFFMCTDKIYIIDQIEHHLPDNWSRKLIIHIKEIMGKLIKYFEAEAILVFVSFLISLFGFWLFNLVGLRIEFPLLTALSIAFVDALPILGSGSVMVPWGIIEAINGNIKLGLAIIILWVIMIMVRNFMEPKMVSKHIGIHPVFTIIAMYTGYKIISIFGLIVGPILLIIFKEVYGPIIDKGIIRSLFERAD